MDVCSHNVNDIAERGTLLLPDIKGLSCGAGSSIAGSLELRFAFSDEARKRTRVTVVVEQSFVTYDDQFHHVPLTPGDNVLDLWACCINTFLVDENTQDDF